MKIRVPTYYMNHSYKELLLVRIFLILNDLINSLVDGYRITTDISSFMTKYQKKGNICNQNIPCLFII